MIAGGGAAGLAAATAAAQNGASGLVLDAAVELGGTTRRSGGAPGAMMWPGVLLADGLIAPARAAGATLRSRHRAAGTAARRAPTE
jgi:pyruvate/2-oxoglutarate dehydrogenase complex dihydrolipoamide dehydrogenase (E3) component